VVSLPRDWLPTHLIRCQPWKAKRGLVVRDRRR